MSATDPFLLDPLKRYGGYKYLLQKQLVRLGQDGTAAAPAISWDEDTDTGFYRIGAGSVGLSLNGTLGPSWGGTGGQFLAIDGSSAAPSYSFASDTDTGIRLFAPGSMDFSLASTSTMILATSQMQMATTGSFGTPSYSFFGDTDSGLYSVGANVVGISTGGQSVFQFGSLNDTHFCFASLQLGAGSGVNTIEYSAPATVTQATNNNTAVTLNAVYGQITMQSAISTGASHTFTVNNSAVDSTSTILLSVNADTAGNDPVVANFNTIVDGTSFNINVFNTDASNATSAAPVVHFWIVGATD